MILISRHGISISLRHLHRILRSLGLGRRNQVTDNHEFEVMQAVREEIQNSGSSLGYRSMTRRLLTRHGIVTSRSRVSNLQRQLDPNGVAGRQNHRFSRRVYVNKGPNYLIHIDGYDKLKRFGFPIHGAICGFSRRVLWLKVSCTNNNPNVVASYFMEYVKEIKGVPRCLRIDAGTENGLIEDIQKAFRWNDCDDMAAEKSVVKGSSHSNQRIERWWLSNKQGGCQYWIDTFKDLESLGVFSNGNECHIHCARFCFMKLLQEELDTVRIEWNQHQIRKSRSESPSGKPDIMYYLPHIYGTVDYKIEEEVRDIEDVRIFCNSRDSQSAMMDPDVSEILERVMREKRLRHPSTFQEALVLYGILAQHFNDLNI